MPPQRVSFQRAAALSSLVREANQTFRANVYASPTYIVPTCCRTLKFGSRSEPNFLSQCLCRPTGIVPTCCRTLKFGSRSEPNFQSQRLCRPNVYRSYVLPHSQVRFAKRTELSEPTFMPPNVYRSNVLPHSQVRFAQRTELSEPTWVPPQRVSFQRAAALSSLVREANRTFRANVYAAPTYTCSLFTVNQVLGLFASAACRSQTCSVPVKHVHGIYAVHKPVLFPVNHILGTFAPASHLLVSLLFFNALEEVWLLKGTKLISHY